MINRRQTLHGAGALAALAPFGMSRAIAAEPAGRVEDLSGEALAELLAKRRPLASGESVFVGDTVMTGEASRIGMMIGKGTTLRLGAMARLTIDRFLLDAGGVVSLKAGPMLLDRPKAAGAQNIQIRGGVRFDRCARHAAVCRPEPGQDGCACAPWQRNRDIGRQHCRAAMQVKARMWRRLAQNPQPRHYGARNGLTRHWPA